MDKIQKIANKFLGLKNPLVLQGIIKESMDRMEDEVEQAQSEQMYRGENADGTEINPTYTRNTVKYKQRKGQPWDRVTLKDTGKFHRANRAEVAPTAIDIINSDSKKGDLVEKYGARIFGLNEKSILLLKPITLQNVRFEMKRYFIS